MKNNPKKGERKEIEVKGMFSFLQNLWVVILFAMLDLANNKNCKGDTK